LKDNLINIIRREQGTGAVWRLHRPRLRRRIQLSWRCCPTARYTPAGSFPSLVGNVLESGLYDIYHGHRARLPNIASGGQACHNCSLKLVCRGCLAIAHSLGLDVFHGSKIPTA
jgi:MoaA/NifB/PqqE/SkfB family radical SAM enzyme